MKKSTTAIFTLLTIMMIIVLGACSVPASTGTPATPTPTEPTQTQEASPAATPSPVESKAQEALPLTEKDLEMVFNGQTFQLKTDAKPLLDTLGKEYEKTESDSCLYEGMDKQFDYATVSIITFPQGKKDIIDEVMITDADFTTSRGIKVGSTKAEVIGAYGDKYKDEGGILVYILSGDPNDLKSPRLQFEIKNDKVSYIDYYSASNQ